MTRALLLLLAALPARAQIAEVHAPPPPIRWAPDPVAEFLDYSASWPARAAAEGSTLRGVIRDLGSGPVAGHRGVRVWADGSRTGDEDRADALALLAALGLTDADRPAESDGAAEAIAVEYERRGAFIASFTPVGPESPALPRSRAPSLRFRFISGQWVTGERGPRRLAIERTTFAFYDPLASEDGSPREPRGIALVMPGLFGTPEPIFDLLNRRLRDEGWCVLHMLSQPSRFTERTRFDLDPDAPFAPPAAAIAAVLTGRAAECAYAAQAAFAHVLTLRPDLTGRARITIGGSGGAMTLPTVVAREPAAYAACVLVAGGADYWGVNVQSNYADWIDAIDARWTRPPTPEDHRALDAAYLAAAPLDSFHTAAALRGTPTLMLHATMDQAVPAGLGEVLWERLGRPERWDRAYGHEFIFMMLPNEFDALVAWLDAAVPRR